MVAEFTFPSNYIDPKPPTPSSLLPTAPTDLIAIPGNSLVSINFTSPSSNGGSAITNYQYTLNGGNTWIDCAPVTIVSPVIIPSLINDTNYQVNLRAINANGNGESSDSVYVTPSSNPYSSLGSGTIFKKNETTFVFNKPNDDTTQFSNQLSSGLLNASSGYVSTAIGDTLITDNLDSFDNVSTIQLSTVTTDWISIPPIDQTMMINNNLSYLTQGSTLLPIGSSANILPPQQISTFNLTSNVWSFSPIVNNTIYGTSNLSSSLPTDLAISPNTVGMRCSAVARIYLPDTNQGIYQLNLWGKISGTLTLLNSQNFRVPLRNWTTLQIPYSINQHVTNLQVEIIQTNTNSNETFYLTLIGAFYHPIGWSFSIDGGSTWNSITTAINNPFAFCSFLSPSSSFKIKATSYIVGSNIKALLIRPKYQQNAYTSQVSINYQPDPRTNEQESRVAPKDHPMFKLNNNYYPLSLTLENTTL